jgi:hypothetical protein
MNKFKQEIIQLIIEMCLALIVLEKIPVVGIKIGKCMEILTLYVVDCV